MKDAAKQYKVRWAIGNAAGESASAMSRKDAAAVVKRGNADFGHGTHRVIWVGAREIADAWVAADEEGGDR